MARTRQPQNPPLIDWRNPLTRDLRCAIVPHLGYDAVTKQLQASGPTAVAARGYGLARSTAYTDAAITFADHPNYAISGSLTIAAWYQELSSSTYGGTIVSRASSDNANTYDLRGSFVNANGDQKPILGRGNTAASGYNGTYVTNAISAIRDTGCFIAVSAPPNITNTAQFYVNGNAVSSTNGNAAPYGPSYTGSSLPLRIGNRWDGAVGLQGYHGLLFLWARELTAAEHAALYANPWQVFLPQRRLWIQLGAAAGGATTDAAIAGTQATDVGAVTVEATTACAIGGTQATDVGAISVEATTGCAVAGTQASDIAAISVDADVGTTTCAIGGTQASDVGALTVEATLGLSLSATQASDVGYIVVEATLPAMMVGTQASDVAAITVAGTSIWTDIGVSATTWSDIGGSTSIWTDL